MEAGAVPKITSQVRKLSLTKSDTHSNLSSRNRPRLAALSMIELRLRLAEDTAKTKAEFETEEALIRRRRKFQQDIETLGSNLAAGLVLEKEQNQLRDEYEDDCRQIQIKKKLLKNQFWKQELDDLDKTERKTKPQNDLRRNEPRVESTRMATTMEKPPMPSFQPTVFDGEHITKYENFRRGFELTIGERSITTARGIKPESTFRPSSFWIQPFKQKLSETDCESDRRKRQITELDAKITIQESKIPKFEAVLQEKNQENAGAFLMLPQHENMTKLPTFEPQNEKPEMGSKIEELESINYAKVNECNISNTMDKGNDQNCKCPPNSALELNRQSFALHCEQNPFSQSLATISHELRETKEKVKGLKADSKNPLDKLHWGKEPPSEGSLTPRPLPTTKREEVKNGTNVPKAKAKVSDNRRQKQRGLSESARKKRSPEPSKMDLKRKEAHRKARQMNIKRKEAHRKMRQLGKKKITRQLWKGSDRQNKDRRRKEKGPTRQGRRESSPCRGVVRGSGKPRSRGHVTEDQGGVTDRAGEVAVGAALGGQEIGDTVARPIIGGGPSLLGRGRVHIEIVVEVEIERKEREKGRRGKREKMTRRKTQRWLVIMMKRRRCIPKQLRVVSRKRKKRTKKHIESWLQQERIEWKFNPPSASHFGGDWEREIRTIRQALMVLMHERSSSTQSREHGCDHQSFSEFKWSHQSNESEYKNKKSKSIYPRNEQRKENRW